MLISIAALQQFIKATTAPVSLRVLQSS